MILDALESEGWVRSEAIDAIGELAHNHTLADAANAETEAQIAAIKRLKRG